MDDLKMVRVQIADHIGLITGIIRWWLERGWLSRGRADLCSRRRIWLSAVGPAGLDVRERRDDTACPRRPPVDHTGASGAASTARRRLRRDIASRRTMAAPSTRAAIGQ
jgi:hypothetical protein